MGLRTDIRTVLIVRELGGSGTAIGVRVIVLTTELANFPNFRDNKLLLL